MDQQPSTQQPPPAEPPPLAAPLSPALAERFLRAWDCSLDFVESYLDSVRSEGAQKTGGDSPESAKDHYERWRVFCFAVGCLKRIQDGRKQPTSEADHAANPNAGDSGSVSDQFAKETEELAEQMLHEGEGEDPVDPLPS